MKLELNLWFNPRNTNGQLNINAGEHVYKFNNFFDFQAFVNRGIGLGVGTSDDINTIIDNLQLDKTAKYVWIDITTFICWNNKNSYVHVFYQGKLFRLEFNTAYQQTTAKYRPHASYKVVI